MKCQLCKSEPARPGCKLGASCAAAIERAATAHNRNVTEQWNRLRSSAPLTAAQLKAATYGK